VVEFKRKEYAGSLRDVVLSYWTMGEMEFKIWWKLEKRGDQKRFYIGILWRNKRDNDRSKEPAEAPDLEHKLVDLGLDLILRADPAKPRLN
jgi:hypothetical protein